MRIICAWCSRVLVDGDGEESHGICPACRLEFIADAGMLRETAKRLLHARARANNADFEKALAEMRRALDGEEEER